MGDPWIALATLIGGGSTMAVVAALIVLVTKDAIATAVSRAGDKEIERLKGQLADQLEEKKQGFERELANERQKAEMALAQFKSVLTLAGAVRQQVAARKVDVVGKIIAMGDVAARRAGDSTGSALHPDLLALGELLRASTHLFRAAVVKEFEVYITSLLIHDHDVKHNDIAASYRRLTAATQKVVEIARAELHVEEI